MTMIIIIIRQLQRMIALPITSIKPHRFAPGAITKPARTRRAAAAVVISGSGAIHIDSACILLHQGTCLLIPPSAAIQLVSAEEYGLMLEWVQLHDSRMDSAPAIDGLCQATMDTDAFARLERTLDQLRRAMAMPSASARMKQQALLYDMIAMIMEQQELSLPHRPPQEAIQAAIDYIEAHYMERLSPGQLPLLAGMTASSFCRSFKKTTGMTPGQYITHCRLAHAKQYMARGNYPLKTIAHQVGFEDELYFSRVFRKSEGVSPTAYLQSRQQRIAVISSLFLQDHLLSLGISPVAAPSTPSYYGTSSGFPSYLHHRLTGTLPLYTENGISLREALRAKPTLIMMNEQSQGTDSSAAIDGDVATVALNWHSDWIDYQQAIASYLHKEAAAERVIRDMDRMERAARDELRSYSRQGTWAIVRLLPGECRIYGREGHALSKLFYAGLGFDPDEHLRHELYVTGGIEQLVAWNPARILLIWSDPEQVRSMRKHPLWRELRAVREGQVYHPNNKEWDPWGPYGRQHMIRDLLRYFNNSRRFV